MGKIDIFLFIFLKEKAEATTCDEPNAWEKKNILTEKYQKRVSVKQRERERATEQEAKRLLDRAWPPSQFSNLTASQRQTSNSPPQPVRSTFRRRLAMAGPKKNRSDRHGFYSCMSLLFGPSNLHVAGMEWFWFFCSCESPILFAGFDLQLGLI